MSIVRGDIKECRISLYENKTKKVKYYIIASIKEINREESELIFTLLNKESNNLNYGFDFFTNYQINEIEDLNLDNQYIFEIYLDNNNYLCKIIYDLTKKKWFI